MWTWEVILYVTSFIFPIQTNKMSLRRFVQDVLSRTLFQVLSSSKCCGIRCLQNFIEKCILEMNITDKYIGKIWHDPTCPVAHYFIMSVFLVSSEDYWYRPSYVETFWEESRNLSQKKHYSLQLLQILLLNSYTMNGGGPSSWGI